MFGNARKKWLSRLRLKVEDGTAFKERDQLLMRVVSSHSLPMNQSWEIVFVASCPWESEGRSMQYRIRMLEGPCRTVHEFDAMKDNWELYFARPQPRDATKPWILLLEVFAPFDCWLNDSVMRSAIVDAPPQWAGDWSSLKPRVVDPRGMAIG